MVTERRSISGIRGTAENLTQAKAVDYCRAFATLLRQHQKGNTILVGRDTRPGAPAYQESLVQALRGCGWDIIDLGVVPTPTLQIAMGKFGAAGGVMVTASHNPADHIGVKFLQGREGQGMFLVKELVDELFALYDRGDFDRRRPGEVRPVADLAGEFDVPPYTREYLDRQRWDLPVDNAVILDYHLHRVVQAMGSELDRIRGCDFRVAMDSCGGAGIPLNYVLLDHLYCRTERVNCTPGHFPRPIEPAPANLAALCRELGEQPEPFAAGFVTDCDNDRCVLLCQDPDNQRYRPLAEDYTFALAVDHVLRRNRPGSTVVTNWSTSQMLEDITEQHHANLRRAPTGEVNTATEALHYHAAIAGEGSCAGVIDPRVGMGRDVLVAIWHILGALTREGEGLHRAAAALPRFCRLSGDAPSGCSLAETEELLQELQVLFSRRPDLRFMSREDGLILSFDNRSRLQVRASNTEPLIRLRVEAVEEGEAEELLAQARSAIAGS